MASESPSVGGRVISLAFRTRTILLGDVGGDARTYIPINSPGAGERGVAPGLGGSTLVGVGKPAEHEGVCGSLVETRVIPLGLTLDGAVQ